MKKYQYSIGLDIGTNSVGWACVNDNYELLKYKGKYALGVHEFESGETAAETRLKRGARRRYNRRKRRIQLLQELWMPLLDNPKLFFSYTEEATAWRQSNQFEEKSLTHVLKLLRMNPSKYPTIYHLRSALMNENKKMDLRLIYLAIHNLVKHRGHFLNGTEEWLEHRSSENLDQSLHKFINQYQQVMNDNHILTEQEVAKMLAIIEEKQLAKTDKYESIKQFLPSTLWEIIRLLLNLSTTFVKLFPGSEQEGLYKELKDSAKFSIGEENLTLKLDVLLETEKEVIELAMLIYQQLQLKQLLNGHDTVSEAKVTSYNKYQLQLQQLKEIVRKYGDEQQYRYLFITSKANWRSYKQKPDIHLLCALDRYTVQTKSNEAMKDMIGSNEEKKDNKNTELYFYVLIRELITSYLQQTDNKQDMHMMQSIINDIAEQKYMVKQVNKENSAIPVQNSMYEARRILSNQSRYYPVITEQLIEQIVQLIRFKIPYFVGPLIRDAASSRERRFGWAVRDQQHTRITPWNFDEVINPTATAEGFITRMTNKCSYLYYEDVLPKHSLLYQDFELLDELNRIQIRRPSEEKHNDYRLDPKLKVWLINEVFRNKVKVTHEDVLKAILRSPWRDQYNDHYDGERYQIFGTSKEKEFASKQTSYMRIRGIFGQFLESDIPLYEEIIHVLTVFNEDQIIRHRLWELGDKYGKNNLLHDDTINELVRWNLSGWGKLSRKLLSGIPVYEHSSLTLIEMLRQQTYVFNELRSPKHFMVSGNKNKEYSFLQKRIQLENSQYEKKKQTYRITYADVKELAGSPAIKRGIWKAIRIIEELVQIFGEPKHIMLEVAREESNNKHRTKSRDEQWKLLGQGLKSTEYASFYKESQQYLDQAKFMQTRFWLYLLQGGKCLYTQESLDVEQLSSYQIDHIIPRSLVKDDSIDNLALVKSIANQRKEDLYVPLEIIPREQHYSVKQYWKSLLDSKLMSRKKYENLVRKSISEFELNGFIERQLVETRQIIKHVQQLLQERFHTTTIHMVKAGIISKFRSYVKLPKVREINNKHHAMDAFLVTVFIQTVIQQYGDNYLQFKLSRKDLNRTLTQQASVRNDFFLFRNFDNQEYPSLMNKGERHSSRQYLREVMYELPWQSTYALGSAEAAFFNETIYSPKLKDKYEQVKDVLNKTELTHKNFNNLFSMIVEVEYIKKKIRRNIIVDVSVYDYYQYRHLSEQELAAKVVEGLVKQQELKNIIFVSLVQKIHKFQRLIYDGQPAYFISSQELRNAKQLKIDAKLYDDVAEIVNSKFLRKQGDESDQNEPNYKEVFSCLGNAILEQYGHLKGVKSEKFDQALNKIVDEKSGESMLREALKVSAANASRSDLLGGRWQMKIQPELMQIMYESITGLNYRK